MGVARREGLLRELRPVVVQRGRRRGVIAAASTAAGLLLIAAAGVAGVERMQRTASAPEVVLETPTVPQAPAEAQPSLAAAPSLGSHTAPVIEVVRTRPGLAVAVSVSPSGSRVPRVSDDVLLAALREAGQEPGLVRVDGRVVVAGDFGR
jgi:hypothetical protein